MSKKRPPKRGKSKSITVDYANTFRFLFAGATDSGWRDAVGSGNETQVRNALNSKGIDVPEPHFGLLVQTCLQIAALPGNGWNLFDNLRAHLIGSGGTGAA